MPDDNTLATILRDFSLAEGGAHILHIESGKRYPFEGQSHADGHYFVRVGDKLVDVARAIFALTNGRWPHRLQRRDGNVFNIHKDNLLELTETVPNIGARSRFKGVYPYPNHKTKPWRVAIYAQRASYTLGYYEDEESGALAYDAFARAILGPTAELNFPNDAPITLNALEQKALRRVMMKVNPRSAVGV